MALNFNEIWEETKLFPNLQEILKKYRANFNGEHVSENMFLDGQFTESEEVSWVWIKMLIWMDIKTELSY